MKLKVTRITQRLDLLRKEGIEVSNRTLFPMLLPAIYFWGIICVCSSDMLSFLNPALFFHSLPMGSCWTACCLSILNFTLCTPHYSLWMQTWKKWATLFTGHLINRTVAQRGWGLHLTAGTGVWHSPLQTIVSVHGVSSWWGEVVKSSSNHLPFSHVLSLYIVWKIEIPETVTMSLPLTANRLWA